MSLSRSLARTVSLKSRLFWFLVALCAWPGLGQFSSGIQGTITDESGAAVPDATIVVTNVATGVSRQVVTSVDRLYRAINLGAGTYLLNATKTEFGSALRDDVHLGISETVRVDFLLEVGQLTEAISIQPRPQMVETEQGRVSGGIERRELNDLPLNGRDIYAPLALQAGVTRRGLQYSGGLGNNDALSSTATIDIHARGSRSDASKFMLDDSGVNSTADGGVARFTPNVDSVEEVRVVSNNVSAVDGRNAGTQVQVISKSGTNEFHGGTSYFFQNNTLRIATCSSPRFRFPDAKAARVVQSPNSEWDIIQDRFLVKGHGDGRTA
jgi:Carboxypeptidase regulatory-like domain